MTYREIAETIRTIPLMGTIDGATTHLTAPQAYEARRQVAFGFANALAKADPRFDRERFLRACGIPGEEM